MVQVFFRNRIAHRVQGKRRQGFPQPVGASVDWTSVLSPLDDCSGRHSLSPFRGSHEICPYCKASCCWLFHPVSLSSFPHFYPVIQTLEFASVLGKICINHSRQEDPVQTAGVMGEWQTHCTDRPHRGSYRRAKRTPRFQTAWAVISMILMMLILEARDIIEMGNRHCNSTGFRISMKTDLEVCLWGCLQKGWTKEGKINSKCG